MALLRRRSAAAGANPESRAGNGGDGPNADNRFLVVGLGNPGAKYDGTPHNIGFRVAAELAGRWELGKARDKFKARMVEGRTRPGGPRVVVLTPLTYMNLSGQAAGPARGSLKVPLDRVIALHDEIDLPFGEVRAKLGGGTAGHNGLKSLRDGFGTNDYWRVRIGVGRPDTTDPARVAAYVLGKFRQSREEVDALVDAAANETERLIDRIVRDAEGPLPDDPEARDGQ